LQLQVHADDEEYTKDPSDSVFANPEYTSTKKGGELKAMISDKSPTTVPILSIKKMTYTCPHCPYESHNSAAFEFHNGLHGSSGCFACDKCSYQTDRWSLSCQHSRLHTEKENAAAATVDASAAAGAEESSKKKEEGKRVHEIKILCTTLLVKF
jgi:hypothetical protein